MRIGGGHSAGLRDLLPGVRHFSAYEVDSERDQPYRPHFPHPRSYSAYAVARVKITGEPLNPPDGETVVEVLTLPVLEAVAYLRAADPVHADVVLHAETLGLLG